MTKSIQDKLSVIRGQLRGAFIDRGAASDGMLIGMLAGENVLLIGPPGTAKSAIARVLCTSIKGADFFTTLVGKTSTPEDLFGPIDIKAFREGRYERRIQGMLPTAHVAHIDEVFRASSAILDTLLKVINERRFDNDGKEVDCPLTLLVGTTNSVPETAELAAFYDRWALKFYVGRLDSEGDRGRLLRLQGEPAIDARLTLAQLKKAQAAVAAIPIPEPVVRSLLNIWRKLTEGGFDLSERKARKVLKLAQARAYLLGRDVVAIEDLEVLADSAWAEPKDYNAIRRIVIQSSAPAVAKALEALDAASAAADEVPVFTGENEVAASVAASGAKKKVRQFIGDVTSFKGTCEARELPRLKGILEELTELDAGLVRRMAEIGRG